MKHLIMPLKMAWSTFRKTKVRSSLTVFGVTIGIAMVILVLSAGNAVKALILDEVSGFGDDWIQTEVKIPAAGKTSQENASGFARGITITTLTVDDMEALKKLKNIGAAYAGVTTQAVISYGQEKKRPSVFGVSASYPTIDKTEVVEGRFYTESEEQSVSQVVVLGSEIRDNLFGNQEAIGRTVKIDGKGYRVVGVMESIGATGFINMDELIYIPLKTVQKKMMGIDHVLWITSQAIDNSKAESTAEEMRAIMRQRHEIDSEEKQDFAITTMNEALSIVETIFTAITYLLVALAAISLLVGGVGIMNVMYVSVAERTFEIGLRKSVGASAKNILHQFLIEAIVITLLGGVAGIIIGVMLAYVISFVAGLLGFSWLFSVSIPGVIISVLFSGAVGLFFGIYPAKKAAAMDPIVALQQE